MAIRRYPIKRYLKTGLFCRILLFIGFIIIAFFLVEQFFSVFSLSDAVKQTLLAFAILFIGGGLIFYFFYCQFKKLADIANDIEKENRSDL